MDTCNICNKSFANKYSLSSHKSRYHPKGTMISPINETSQDVEDGKSNHEESEHGETDHERLDEENSDNGDMSTSDKSLSGSGEENHSDNGSEIETEDTNQTSGESDGLGLPDQLSDNFPTTRKRNFPETDSESTNGKKKRSKQYRNRKSRHLFTDDDDVVQLLSSINKKLQEHGDRTFSLLACHRLKYAYFTKLATEMFGSPTKMENYLSDDEFWLVDAVCKNDIEIISKLLHDNVEIVQKVLENVAKFAENSG